MQFNRAIFDVLSKKNQKTVPHLFKAPQFSWSLQKPEMKQTGS